METSLNQLSMPKVFRTRQLLNHFARSAPPLQYQIG